jgi:uncharacterized integral membrane protein (TIGR00698 family)
MKATGPIAIVDRFERSKLLDPQAAVTDFSGRADMGPAMFRQKARQLIPGTTLCIAVSVAATVLERLEGWLLGRAWVEALVLAIMLGAVVRTVWSPSRFWLAGINFSAKTLLDIAVMLLGASISTQTIMAGGPWLLIGITVVVVVTIGASYGMGRLLRLPRRMALLVACGNSICGNSAIAVVAPVIGADGEDVAASIAFTAVLGVFVVLLLPALAVAWHLGGLRYGVLAGLTVYAVPQVLAATAPLGTLAVQTGTLVKLMRVLMLGPVVLGLSLLTRRWRDDPDEPTTHRSASEQLPLHRLIPWYILGFLVLLGLRSFGLTPLVALKPMAVATSLLTVIAMAALGLSTEIRGLMRAGGRVTAAVTGSLLLLGGVSLGLIQLLGIP